jgi:ATP-dependent DNA ligase
LGSFERAAATSCAERERADEWPPLPAGREIFEHVCKMGLEGIVSKRRDHPYVSGRTKCWIKVRNPASAAMLRYEEGTF